MTAEVLSFPPRAQGFSPASSSGAVGEQGSILRTRRKYSFADVVQLCGLEDYEPRTQVDHLRALHDQCGLPAPRGARLWGGRVMRGAAAICQRSTWCALEFDAWHDRQQSPPPAGGSALPPPASPAIRAECRDRALQLASG